MNESVSLDKKKQGKFSKKVSAVKDQIKKGNIVVKEAVNKVSKRPKRERGVVYIGHIPHGFYESEMKQYFLQFGKVTNVRVCRSEKTGRSKGYGFVEFLEPEVAKVVANTMDNYLMFKRRLEAKYIPPEKQQKNLFKGRAWNENHTPYKHRITKITQLRNSNKAAVKSSKLAVTKVNNKLKKLAALGISHKFQPINVEEPLEGTTPLLKKNPVIAKEIKKESKTLKKNKPKSGLISKIKKAKTSSVKEKIPLEKTDVKSSKKSPKKLKNNLNDTKTELHGEVIKELKSKLGSKSQTEGTKMVLRRKSIVEVKSNLRTIQKKKVGLAKKKEKLKSTLKAVQNVLQDNTLVKIKKSVKAK